MQKNFQDNNVQEFEQYFLKNMLPQLKIWEKKRRKYMMIFIFISCVVLLWTGILLINFKGEISQILNTWGFMICMLIVITCYPLLMYYQRSKESLLPLIINFFGAFSYQYRPQIEMNALRQSKIIKENEFTRSDDAFYGEYMGVKVNIIEYTTQRQSTDRKDETTSIRQSMNNYGILFSADMNKKFSGQTIVVEDRGILNNFRHYKNLKRVSFEDPLFEKKFEVYGDDQIEARYILTSAMIEQMLKLKEFFPKICFSFFNGKVLINIKTKKNSFECNNIFRSLLNFKNIKQTFIQMNALFSIIRILELNQKKML